VNRFNGQAAIVTGGTSGIGRAIALALAREGASVAVVGRNAERLDETVALIRATRPDAPSFGLRLDVGREEDMQEMAQTAVERLGRIDILVAAAGRGATSESMPAPCTVAEVPLAEWDAIMETNLRGVFLSNRAVLPAMIKQAQGSIVNVASYPGAVRANPFAAVYCASKHAVLGLTRALAEEMRPHNVRVWALLPGPTDTPMLRRSRALAPLGMLKPEAVADLLVEALALPGDTVMEDPIIAPFGAGRLEGHAR
jgi:NAD(P)-dependent dehydrogenase (short-subunit alcohol dehydrogenase family)